LRFPARPSSVLRDARCTGTRGAGAGACTAAGAEAAGGLLAGAAAPVLRRPVAEPARLQVSSRACVVAASQAVEGS